MKKLILLGTFCLTSLSLMAQSTCETRVDAHQEATTTKRVAYCLTPEYTAPSQTTSDLVYSSVSAPAAPAPATAAEKPTAKAGYFKPQKYTVSREYVDSKQFPQVPQGNVAPAPAAVTHEPNGAASVAAQEFVYVPAPTVGQELPQEPAVAQTVAVGPATTQMQAVPVPAASEAAVLTQDEFEYVPAPSTPLGQSEVVWVQPAQTSAAPEAPVAAQPSESALPKEHFMIDEVDTNGNLITQVEITETKAGLKARQNKPGRQLVKATETEPATAQIPAQDPAYTYHEDLTQPYEPEEIPAGTVSYAPATPAATTNDEIPAGTVSYAPATAN